MDMYFFGAVKYIIHTEEKWILTVSKNIFDTLHVIIYSVPQSEGLIQPKSIDTNTTIWWINLINEICIRYLLLSNLRRLSLL